MGMTRAEHLAWSKARALEYVNAGDLAQAVASMLSDLGNHPEFDRETTTFLSMVGAMDAARGDAAAVRRWVEGFN